MEMSEPAVRNLLSVDKAPEPVKEAIREKRITATEVAKPAFKKLTPEQQVDVVKPKSDAPVNHTEMVATDEGVAKARAKGKLPRPSKKPEGKIGAKEIVKRVAAVKGEEASFLPSKKQWRELVKFVADGGAADLAGGGARKNGFILCAELITGMIKVGAVPGFKKAMKNIGADV